MPKVHSVGRYLPPSFRALGDAKREKHTMNLRKAILHGLLASVAAIAVMNVPASAQQSKRPNVVMLMTDDTGWNDFGAYSGGGKALGHPTPISIGSLRKVQPLRAGTAKQAAPQVAPHS
jgi:hypothetical protein